MAVIGVISDSHDNLPAVRKAVLAFRDAGCDLVIHAGDFVAPFAVLELKGLGCPVRAVFGNCDGERQGLRKAFVNLGEVREAPFVFTHGGRKILVSHLNSPVAGYVRKRACDVIVFGHTHKPEVRKEGGVLRVNPGEAGGWLHGRMTVALLDPATLEAEILTLE